MDYYRLLYEFLDGDISADDEAVLFQEMATNAELRSEMKQFLAIDEAIQNDPVAFSAPPSAGQAVFDTLGISTPITADVSAIAESTILSSLLSTRTITWMVTIMGASIVLFTSDASQKTSIAHSVKKQNTSEHSYPISRSSEIIYSATDQAADNTTHMYSSNEEMSGQATNFQDRQQEIGGQNLSTEGDNSASNNGNGNITGNNDLPSNSLANNSFFGGVTDIEEDQHGNFDVQEEPYSTIHSSSLMAENIIGVRHQAFSTTFDTENNQLISPDLTAPTNISIQQGLSSLFGIPVSVEFRGPAAVGSFPNLHLQNLQENLFDNTVVDILFATDELHTFGVSFGREMFSQEFSLQQDDRSLLVQQQPSLLWVGATYRYYFVPSETLLRPFSQVTLGATEIGAQSRALMGVMVAPLQNVQFVVGIEGMGLLYQQEGWGTSYKLGLMYGLCVAF
jgi:hypothetical protein